MRSFKKHTSLSDDVNEYVKDLISRGEIKPGERLFYDDIGKKLGISVTPWRESMLKLEKEGLVVTVPRGGTYVRKLDAKEISDIYEIREALEGIAAREAASGLNDGEIGRLTGAVDEFEHAIGASELKDCVEADFHFHFLIVEMGRNEKLASIVRTYNLQLVSIFETGPNYRKNAKNYLNDHIEILRAIRDRNPDMAERQIRKHIRNGKDMVLSSKVKDERDNLRERRR